MTRGINHPTPGWAPMVVVVTAALSGGCASITGSELQSVTVITRTRGGLPVREASCTLNNDRGIWIVSTPGSVVVQRSAGDLSISCEKEGLPTGTGRAVSRANAGMFGNIIFGGAVGAVVDHGKGTAYDYPNLFQIEMGGNQVFGIAANGGDPEQKGDGRR